MGDSFYISREWRVIRYAAIRASKGCCSACGRSPREDGIKLHVDHIKPRSTHPRLELLISNLQILCEDCNLGKSNSDCINWSRPTSKQFHQALRNPRKIKRAQKKANRLIETLHRLNKGCQIKQPFVQRTIIRKQGVNPTTTSSD